MPKKHIIQQILECYEKGETELPAEAQKYKERIDSIIRIKLEDLFLTDFEIYRQIRAQGYEYTLAQAMNDISVAERIIGNAKDPTRDSDKVWDRYFISQVTMKAMRIAEQKGDPYTMGYLANIYGRHNHTDKEDVERMPFDEIVPFVPEITSDPSVLGIEPIPNLEEEKAKLKKKYQIPDAEIITNERSKA